MFESFSPSKTTIHHLKDKSRECLVQFPIQSFDVMFKR